MKELDLVLDRYLRERWPVASTAERRTFDALLELPDPQLAAYLVAGETASDPEMESLLAGLRSQPGH